MMNFVQYGLITFQLKIYTHVSTNKGSLQNKKTAKFGNCSQLAGDPPTLAYLGILNCYFFIGYLGLLDHEMDFEINLFFSFTKVA